MNGTLLVVLVVADEKGRLPVLLIELGADAGANGVPDEGCIPIVGEMDNLLNAGGRAPLLLVVDK